MTKLRMFAAASLLAFGAAAAVSTGSFAQGSNIVCNAAGCNTLGNSVQAFLQNGIQSFVKTYTYSSVANTAAATPTDVLTITGSATKTVHINRIVVGGNSTNGGQTVPIQVLRRSVANTYGTSTAPTFVPRDTNNTAATATLALYTANPGTQGAVVGTLDVCRLYLAGSISNPSTCVFDYGRNSDQLVTLRGTSDILSLYFTAQSLPSGASFDIEVETTEEP